MARAKASSLLSGALALVAMTAPAAAEGIEIVMNQAKIVKLARAADTVVIGNPQIADASVQDANTIVLTAKGFGVTNLVVLDVDGNPVVDEQVTVSRQTTSSLRIFRRADVQTMSCTPFCESAYKTPAEMSSEAEQTAKNK